VVPSIHYSGVNPQVAEAATNFAAPQRQPDTVRSPLIAGGGVFGAVMMVSGLFYVLSSKKSSYAMATTAGEPVRPTMPAPPKEEETPASFVTVEYQRKQAKALFEYYEKEELAKTQTDAQVFGWTPANEISNGRWVMFGWLVGMLTEYATGASFVDQIKITLNNLAILDLD
jgi:hypothetical protein